MKAQARLNTHYKLSCFHILLLVHSLQRLLKMQLSLACAPWLVIVDCSCLHGKRGTPCCVPGGATALPCVSPITAFFHICGPNVFVIADMISWSVFSTLYTSRRSRYSTTSTGLSFRIFAMLLSACTTTAYDGIQAHHSVLLRINDNKQSCHVPWRSLKSARYQMQYKLDSCLTAQAQGCNA